MKKLTLLLYFFYTGIFANAQEENEYSAIDKIVMEIPVSQTNSTSDIAAYIKYHFNTDEKKIRATYTWVANNIKYDADSVHRVILEEDRDQKVTFALRRKKGVCENFAAIFNDLCEKSGIRSFVIEGYTKQGNTVDKEPHVWCAALINNKWFLYDPTWDAGFINNGRFENTSATNYFQISPEAFIQTHFPYDPLFQFLNYPITFKEFIQGNTGIDHHKPFFNVIDSIAAYEKMDSLDRYLLSLSRIERNEISAVKNVTKTKQLKLEVELIYQDRDMALYDEAVADYNEAIAVFNNFILWRNNQFQPAKKNEEIEETFNDIRKELSAANFKLSEINKTKAILTLDTGDLQKKLNDLDFHIKEQEIFLKEYLKK